MQKLPLPHHLPRLLREPAAPTIRLGEFSACCLARSLLLKRLCGGRLGWCQWFLAAYSSLRWWEFLPSAEDGQASLRSKPPTARACRSCPRKTAKSRLTARSKSRLSPLTSRA